MADRPDEKPPAEPKRQLGVWDHLGVDLPEDLFIGPDPETVAAADGSLFPRPEG